jgi:phosphate/sulfate permease
VAKEIVTAWITTIPAAAVVAAIFYELSWMFG